MNRKFSGPLLATLLGVSPAAAQQISPWQSFRSDMTEPAKIVTFVDGRLAICARVERLKNTTEVMVDNMQIGPQFCPPGTPKIIHNTQELQEALHIGAGDVEDKRILTGPDKHKRIERFIVGIINDGLRS